ncbi:MAG: hypothetical protein E6G81_08715 [Alphaproteobacteria bacterium]|nr:MAG: hypothetical protein E6G81_08715 [Alphaproteobacteria bacterium]
MKRKISHLCHSVKYIIPGQAAQPAGANETSAAALPAGADDPISFEQYREWRLRFIERRQTQLTAQLAAADLQPRQRARLEQAKAYYDWFAGLPEADRDRRFRARFDQIDANHDGTIDHAERATWHDKQQAFYGRNRATAEPAAVRQSR